MFTAIAFIANKNEIKPGRSLEIIGESACNYLENLFTKS